jgi:hypothetical protein
MLSAAHAITLPVGQGNLPGLPGAHVMSNRSGYMTLTLMVWRASCSAASFVRLITAPLLAADATFEDPA